MNILGQMMMSPRKSVSLILGVIFLVLGLIPLLNQFGIIGFNLPNLADMILWIVAVIGGVWLFVDGFTEMGFGIMSLKTITFFVGFLVLAFGLVPLLNSFGVIGFVWPAFVASIIHFLFTLGGVFLFIGGFRGF